MALAGVFEVLRKSKRWELGQLRRTSASRFHPRIVDFHCLFEVVALFRQQQFFDHANIKDEHH
jgi:hypothetical protein